MLTPEPEGSAACEEAAGRTPGERYADEAWLQANRAHRRMTAERNLAVRQIDWASQAMGGVSIHARDVDPEMERK